MPAISRIHALRSSTICVVIGLAAAAALVPAPVAHADEPEGIHKIQHVIMIMQENRSFDSYFGTYPGANGIPGGVCLPDPHGGCLAPFHNASEKNWGGPHGAEAADDDIDGGKMDGFIEEAEARTKCQTVEPECNPCTAHGIEAQERCDDVMGYHDAREIPNYWKYAEKFVLQDNLFESVASWSLPEHLYLSSGWSAICPHGDPNPFDCVNSREPESPSHSLEGPLIPGKTTYAWTDSTYLMAKHGVSWRYFIFEGDEPDCDNDEAVECAPKPLKAVTPGIWNPLPDFVDVKEDGQLGNIQSLNNFYTDVHNQESCGLPNVSWVIPDLKVSEHPRATLAAGQTYVTTLINSIMRSPCWGSTAIFLSWDDWGGFYDHVVPPQADENGYGMRVPGLVISPYAKRGFIDHQQLSHDAYLKFIEDDFLGGQRLNPATDGRPDPRISVREEAPGLGDLSEDFDFNQTPRPPTLLSPEPAPGPPSKVPGTTQLAPTVITEGASHATHTTVSLAGSVNPNLGMISGCSFEYGTTSELGASAPCSALPEYGETREPVTAEPEGLTPGTTYFYRLAATDNIGQTSDGATSTFTTTGGQRVPQIGRCVAVHPATGPYSDAKCTVLSGNENSGGFVWQPGAPGDGFSGTIAASKLGPSGKQQVGCTGGIFAGVVGGPTTVNGSIELEGCKAAKGNQTCQTVGSPAGTISSSPLTGQIGVISGGASPSVGIAMAPAGEAAPVIGEYECTGSGERISEIGAVIGSTGIDAMSTALAVHFQVKAGRQQPEAFEGGPTSVLTALIDPLEGVGSEAPATLNADLKGSYEQAVEIKAIM